MSNYLSSFTGLFSSDPKQPIQGAIQDFSYSGVIPGYLKPTFDKLTLAVNNKKNLLTEYSKLPALLKDLEKFVKRKNIEGLLKAYFSEFRHNEPVSLVIKVGKNDKDKCEALVREVGVKCKLKSIPKVNIIADYLSETEIMQLHQLIKFL